jgi:hypothetical protein
VQPLLPLPRRQERQPQLAELILPLADPEA